MLAELRKEVEKRQFAAGVFLRHRIEWDGEGTFTQEGVCRNCGMIAGINLNPSTIWGEATYEKCPHPLGKTKAGYSIVATACAEDNSGHVHEVPTGLDLLGIPFYYVASFSYPVDMQPKLEYRHLSEEEHHRLFNGNENWEEEYMEQVCKVYFYDRAAAVKCLKDATGYTNFEKYGPGF